MSPRRRLTLAVALAATSALIATGCGGGGGGGSDAELPVADIPTGTSATPVAAAPAAPGQPVRAGAATPKDVAKALAGSDVVVVAFLVEGVADDESVEDALATARASGRAASGVDWFTYRVGKDQFGDLADVLGVKGTPTVAVIGRDRILANLWAGLVDADILLQSISDAKDRAAANLADAAKAGKK